MSLWSVGCVQPIPNRRYCRLQIYATISHRTCARMQKEGTPNSLKFISVFPAQRQPIGREMNERRLDFEQLRDFARRGDQAAFTSVVRRHLNLVYSVALRKLSDETAAEEITQDVFTALARNAWHFTPDDSVPAWLYRTTLLKCKAWWRAEIRRRRREQTAAELSTTMRTSPET